MDNRQLVILLNGFQKKSDKTPREEIRRAVELMKEYYQNRKDHGNQNLG